MSTVPSAEMKLRNLAAVNAQMVADFTWPNTAGAQTFQWFDRSIVQGDLGKPSDGRMCVTVRRVSTVRQANQGGVGNLTLIRFQLNITGYNAEALRRAAADVVAFMNSISLCNAGNYASPVTAPNQNPNCLLNERAGMLPELSPPAYVETMDWRCFNLETIPA